VPRHIPLAVGGLITLGLTAAAPAYPALADHESSPLENRDNNSQEFDSHSLSTQSQLACSHGKAQLGDQTEISVSVGDADVHCYDQNLGTSLGGTTSCPDTTIFGRCDHYRVTFNTYFQTTNPLTDAQWKSIGCHEMGHTSSVDHRTAASDPNSPYSCLRNGADQAAAGYPTTYDSHDVTAINSDA
jgi:hypothetical protein